MTPKKAKEKSQRLVYSLSMPRKTVPPLRGRKATEARSLGPHTWEGGLSAIHGRMAVLAACPPENEPHNKKYVQNPCPPRTTRQPYRSR